MKSLVAKLDYTPIMFLALMVVLLSFSLQVSTAHAITSDDGVDYEKDYSDDSDYKKDDYKKYDDVLACPAIAKVCDDGSIAKRKAGSCEQYCHYEKVPHKAINIDDKIKKLFDGFGLGTTIDKPLPASGDARIKALEDRIKQLQDLVKRIRGGSSNDKVKDKVKDKVTDYKKRPATDKPWCRIAWNRNLKVGDRGSDVKALQQFLNNKGFKVSDKDEGSSGKETDYFGQKTADALSKFQDKYHDTVLKPAGADKGTGFFGSLSRDKIKRLCGDHHDKDKPKDDKDHDKKDGFEADDIKSVTRQYVDPSPNIADEEYYLYVIKFDDGDAIRFKHAAFTYPGSLEEKLRSLGYLGDMDDFNDLIEDVKDSDSSGDIPDFDISVDGLTATVAFGLSDGCQGYRIRWGDARSDSEAATKGDVCTDIYRNVELTHNYNRAGQYKIKLTVNGGDGSVRYASETIEVASD